MISFIENPFGFGKYEIKGEKAEKAAEEFEIMLGKLNNNFSDVGNFILEQQLFAECMYIIEIIEEKYDVEIYLYGERCTS